MQCIANAYKTTKKTLSSKTGDDFYYLYNKRLCKVQVYIIEEKQSTSLIKFAYKNINCKVDVPCCIK